MKSFTLTNKLGLESSNENRYTLLLGYKEYMNIYLFIYIENIKTKHGLSKMCFAYSNFSLSWYKYISTDLG